MDKVLLDKVTAARQDVTDAEDQLAKVIREVQVAPRAEKTMVSTAIEDAFAKLMAVKARLLELQDLLESGEEGQDAVE